MSCTMVDMENELTLCRRFVSAWKRFRRNKDDYDNNIKKKVILYRQYRHIAKNFRDTAQRLEKSDNAWNILLGELTEILSKIDTEMSSLPDIYSAFGYTISKQVEHDSTATISPQIKSRPQLPLSGFDTLKLDDFDALIEATEPAIEKKSPSGLRRKLGLDDKRNNHIESKFKNRTRPRRDLEPNTLQTDIIQMAKVLKEKTKGFHIALAEDIQVLEQVGNSAETNANLLDQENHRLKRQIDHSIGFWTSVWLISVLFALFILTYLYIKLFSRK